MKTSSDCKLTEYEIIFKSLENNKFALDFTDKQIIILKEVFCPNCNIRCSCSESHNQYRCVNIIRNCVNLLLYN